MKNIPVVILAGGFGTRLREETEFKPKPMVEIGNKPILWHIMKTYSHYGFNKFIICLGYKGHMIKNYFLNYHWQGVDITVNTKTGNSVAHCCNDEDWEVTLAETGENCYTGGRVARAIKYVDASEFMLTYGDGLSDVNIEKLYSFHKSHNKLITLTGAKNPFRFGNLNLSGDQVIEFQEKKDFGDSWINGGFFVVDKKFVKYLSEDSSCVLEKQPLSSAALDGNLMVYKHHGFWRCVDTVRDYQALSKLWKDGAPWKIWEKEKCSDMIVSQDSNVKQATV